MWDYPSDYVWLTLPTLPILILSCSIRWVANMKPLQNSSLCVNTIMSYYLSSFHICLVIQNMYYEWLMWNYISILLKQFYSFHIEYNEFECFHNIEACKKKFRFRGQQRGVLLTLKCQAFAVIIWQKGRCVTPV